MNDFPVLLSTIPGIASGIAALTAQDADFQRVLSDNGPLEFTLKPGGFVGMVRIVLGQQVSVLAAAAMWRKLEAGLPEISPLVLAAQSDADLRLFGFSGQKSRYVKSLAADILEQRLDLEEVARMPDEDAIARLTQSIGIGRWTAENYLIFCEGRADMFPAKDLAILIGLEWLKGFDHRPGFGEAAEYALRWAPYRTAASLLIWHHYIGTVERRRTVKTSVATI
jgi:DNA-3-methyladenine glycosylase II